MDGRRQAQPIIFSGLARGARSVDAPSTLHAATRRPTTIATRLFTLPLGVFLLGVGLGQTDALANNPHCDGPASPRPRTTNCAAPQANEVVVYADSNYGGLCLSFSADVSPGTPGSSPGHVPSLSAPDFGFNDCISSVKVGSNVRLLAYQNDNYNVQTEIVALSPLATRTTHNDNWHMATYESGNTAQTVNDDFSSLIIQRIDQTTGERIPNFYQGSSPTNNDDAFWEMESQGLCHNKTHWFITQEATLPDVVIPQPPRPFDTLPPTLGAHCSLAADPRVTSVPRPYPFTQNFSCINDCSNKNLTGRIWKVPRDGNLSAGQAPPGSSHRDLQDFNILQNTTMGYRHFGDPDCQTIGNNDYVFIPVQGCTGTNGDNPLPYVLVLDSNLNFVASLIIPPAPPANVNFSSLEQCLGVGSSANPYSDLMHKGMASWVAVRPGKTSPASVEVWMSTDICAGEGIQIFTANLTQSGTVTMSLKPPSPKLLDVAGLPKFFGSLQGGVFSPSGKTLYISTGSVSSFGGIRVINPDTGAEFLESGNNYGQFNYQQEMNFFCVPVFGCVPTGQEPEGLDFLDSRCPGTPVANTGRAGSSSQLHVVLLHNGLDDSGDQVELKHYSFAGNDAPPQCDGAGGASGTGGTGGSGGSIGPGGASGTGGTGGTSAWACISQCSSQTQSDLKICENYLACYVSHGCGPNSCGGQDQICGVNTIGGGMAAKDIADSAFNCLLHSGGSGNPPTVNACLQAWQSTNCALQCTSQTQSDRRMCATYLDCYYMNGCGPLSSCATQDGICGVNTLGGGTAAKSIADQVYQCLACP